MYTYFNIISKPSYCEVKNDVQFLKMNSSPIYMYDCDEGA